MLTNIARAADGAAVWRRAPRVLRRGRRTARLATGSGRRRYGIAVLALMMLASLGFTLKAPAASALGDFHYSIIHTYDGQYCLDADGSDPAPGGPVWQWGCSYSDHYLQWVVIDISSAVSPDSPPGGPVHGIYMLQNVGSGLCLSTDPGAYPKFGLVAKQSIVQEPCSSPDSPDPSQVWWDYATSTPGIGQFFNHQVGCLKYDSSNEQDGGGVYGQFCLTLDGPDSSNPNAQPNKYWMEEYTW